MCVHDGCLTAATTTWNTRTVEKVDLIGHNKKVSTFHSKYSFFIYSTIYLINLINQLQINLTKTSKTIKGRNSLIMCKEIYLGNIDTPYTLFWPIRWWWSRDGRYEIIIRLIHHEIQALGFKARYFSEFHEACSVCSVLLDMSLWSLQGAALCTMKTLELTCT